MIFSEEGRFRFHFPNCASDDELRVIIERENPLSDHQDEQLVLRLIGASEGPLEDDECGCNNRRYQDLLC
jgi:hypothetical protein